MLAPIPNKGGKRNENFEMSKIMFLVIIMMEKDQLAFSDLKPIILNA